MGIRFVSARLHPHSPQRAPFFLTAECLWESERCWTHARSHLGFFWPSYKLLSLFNKRLRIIFSPNFFLLVFLYFCDVCAAGVNTDNCFWNLLRARRNRDSSEKKDDCRRLQRRQAVRSHNTRPTIYSTLPFTSGWGRGGVVSQSPASISCANSPHDLLRFTSAPPHSSSCRPPARQLRALRHPPDPVLNLNVLIALQTPLLATPSLSAGPILFLSGTSHLPLFLQPSRPACTRASPPPLRSLTVDPERHQTPDKTTQGRCFLVAHWDANWDTPDTGTSFGPEVRSSTFSLCCRLRPDFSLFLKFQML